MLRISMSLPHSGLAFTKSPVENGSEERLESFDMSSPIIYFFFFYVNYDKISKFYVSGTWNHSSLVRTLATLSQIKGQV